MDFRKYVDKYKDEAVSFLQQLVKINSILDLKTKSDKAPFGQGINDCLETFLKKAQMDGFDCLNDDGYALRIKLKGKSDESIAVLGHLDVVPVDESWTYPPFSATIKDHLMYGRGTTDDKGPVVASYMALKILKEEGFLLNKNIELILGTDEETAWRGIHHYMEKYQIPALGFSPDADWPIINGEKGILRLDIIGDGLKSFSLEGGQVYNAVIGSACARLDSDLSQPFMEYLKEHKLNGDVRIEGNTYNYHLIGKTAHAMAPQMGVNAGLHLARFLNNHINHPTLRFITDCLYNDFNLQKLGMKVEHEVMGIVTSNVGIIEIDEEHTRITLDIRFPIGFNFDDFKEAFKNILRVYGLSYELKENREPHYVDINSDLVKTLYKSYTKYTNDFINKPKTIGGGTYAKILKHGVAFGMEDPTKPSVCHISDEYIDLNRFFEAIAIYADAIYELGK